MAISDQITRLRNKIEEQRDLIAELDAAVDALPEAGSGGTDIETCTLTREDHESSYPIDILATQCIDNKITVNKYTSDPADLPFVIENIVKNSLVYFEHVTENSDALQKFILTHGGDMTSIFQITGDATFKSYACFVKGTRITLANGKTKNVEDIEYTDDLLVWDFDNGCYTYAKPLWIKNMEIADYYYRCVFDNGIILNLVGSNGNCHRVFNIDDNRFEYANNCVGKHVKTQNGDSILLSCERIDKKVEFYNIITFYHMNLFAESVLTSCRFNNIYPIKNMKFVKDNRDIIPYEAYNVNVDFYKGLRLAEQNFDTSNNINEYIDKNCISNMRSF